MSGDRGGGVLVATTSSKRLVGSAVGSPVGSEVGWAVGSAVGSARGWAVGYGSEAARPGSHLKKKRTQQATGRQPVVRPVRPRAGLARPVAPVQAVARRNVRPEERRVGRRVPPDPVDLVITSAGAASSGIDASRPGGSRDGSPWKNDSVGDAGATAATATAARAANGGRRGRGAEPRLRRRRARRVFRRGARGSARLAGRCGWQRRRF